MHWQMSLLNLHRFLHFAGLNSGFAGARNAIPASSLVVTAPSNPYGVYTVSFSKTGSRPLIYHVRMLEADIAEYNVLDWIPPLANHAEYLLQVRRDDTAVLRRLARERLVGENARRTVEIPFACASMSDEKYAETVLGFDGKAWDLSTAERCITPAWAYLQGAHSALRYSITR